MNKTVLITGASRGIGKAIADKFNGSKYTILSPKRSELDLASNSSINEYIKKHSSIDILINNAGINELVYTEEITDDILYQMIQVNLISCINLTKMVAPKMRFNKFGRIVNVSSIWSEYSKPKRVLYSTVKSAINGFTRAVAVEFASDNVLINAVAPGFVNTELTSKNNSITDIDIIKSSLPIKRLAEPYEIAEVVHFLASENNSYITGQTIFVDGGFSCV